MRANSTFYLLSFTPNYPNVLNENESSEGMKERDMEKGEDKKEKQRECSIRFLKTCSTKATRQLLCGLKFCLRKEAE